MMPVAIALVLGAAGGLLARRLLATYSEAASLRRVTVYLLIVFLLARSLRHTFLPSSHVDEVASGTVTLSAAVWIAAVLMLSAWVSVLWLRHPRIMRKTLGQAGKPVLLLLSLYTLAAFTSPALLLSLFYTIELTAAIFALAYTLRDPLPLTKVGLILSVWLFLHLGLASLIAISNGEALARTPSYGIVAGAVFFISLQSFTYDQTLGNAMWALAAVLALIQVNSLAAYISALVAALGWLVIKGLGSYGTVIWCWWLSLLAVEVAFQPFGIYARVLAFGADAMGRPSESVDTLTGRLPLWNRILEQLEPGLWGLGLGFERSAVLDGVFSGLVWSPTHAHNGFLSAWLSGGWLGLFAAAWVTVLMVRRSTMVGRREQGFVAAVVIIVVAGNLTNSAVTGNVAGVARPPLGLLDLFSLVDGRTCRCQGPDPAGGSEAVVDHPERFGVGGAVAASSDRVVVRAAHVGAADR